MSPSASGSLVSAKINKTHEVSMDGGVSIFLEIPHGMVFALRTVTLPTRAFSDLCGDVADDQIAELASRKGETRSSN